MHQNLLNSHENILMQNNTLSTNTPIDSKNISITINFLTQKKF